MATILSLGAGLLAVVAIIYGCAWLIRRMGGMTGMNNNAIKVVSVLAIGVVERIALVEVGQQQILLGITPTTIRTLHVFDQPVVDAGNAGSSDCPQAAVHDWQILVSAREERLTSWWWPFSYAVFPGLR